MKIGVIDIGSNSIKMILANTDKGLTIEKKLREYVRLSEGGSKILSEDKINASIEALKKFKEECKEADKLIAAATEAVRSAENQQEFIDRVKKAVGLKIRVLSGKEEAYFDYLATVSSMQVEDNDLLIDMGGGSTELILVKNGKIQESVSLPFGALVLKEKFKINNNISKDQENKLREYVCEYLNKLSWINKSKGHNLIGLGGSIRNICRIELSENKEPLELLHKHFISDKEMKNIYERITSDNGDQWFIENGFEKERIGVIVTAAMIVCMIMDMLYMKKIIFSEYGIREGLAYEEMRC